jgi:hypothetical protein
MLGLDPPPPSQAPTVISSCSAPPKPASSTHCIGTQRLGGNSLFQELLTPPMSSQILVRMNEILRALFLLSLPSSAFQWGCMSLSSNLLICLQAAPNLLREGSKRSEPRSFESFFPRGKNWYHWQKYVPYVWHIIAPQILLRFVVSACGSCLICPWPNTSFNAESTISQDRYVSLAWEEHQP